MHFHNFTVPAVSFQNSVVYSNSINVPFLKRVFTKKPILIEMNIQSDIYHGVSS